MTEPPIPVHDFMKSDALRRADIVLARGKKLTSRLIRWATRSYFSHAAIIFLVPKRDRGFERTFVLEAVSSGVDVTDFEHYASDPKRYDVAVLRLEEPWFDEDVHKLVRGHMLNFIKSGYDYGSAWRILRRAVRRIFFGLSARRRSLAGALRLEWSKNRLAPADFICSGFVQYGYARAAQKLVDEGSLAAGRLATVLFHGGSTDDLDAGTLLAVTPEDIARAPQLTWKYVIRDRQVFPVSTRAEAYALLDPKARHLEPDLADRRT